MDTSDTRKNNWKGSEDDSIAERWMIKGKQMSQTIQEQLDSLRQRVSSFEKEHADFRSVHVSRRGVEGRPGEKGEPGVSNAVGPKGETGPIGTTGATGATGAVGATGSVGAKGDRGEQGDITEALTAAKYHVTEKLIEFQRNLKQVIVRVLTDCGFLDQDGKAVTGPTGATGASGATGATGESGRDGQDSFIAGEKGDKGDIGETGATGETGASGARGGAGDITAAVANAEKAALAVVEKRLEQFRSEMLSEITANIRKAPLSSYSK